MAVIPAVGKQWIIDKVQDVAPASNAKMNIGGWGTGSTAEGSGVTMASITEPAEVRQTGTLSQPAADTDRLVWTMTATASRSITQAFRTNATTVGGTGETLFFYALFSALPLATGDGITFTADHQQT